MPIAIVSYLPAFRRDLFLHRCRTRVSLQVPKPGRLVCLAASGGKGQRRRAGKPGKYSDQDFVQRLVYYSLFTNTTLCRLVRS